MTISLLWMKAHVHYFGKKELEINSIQTLLGGRLIVVFVFILEMAQYRNYFSYKSYQ